MQGRGQAGEAAPDDQQVRIVINAQRLDRFRARGAVEPEGFEADRAEGAAGCVGHVFMRLWT